MHRIFIKMKVENGFYWVRKPDSTDAKDFSVLYHEDGDWYDTWDSAMLPESYVDGALITPAQPPTEHGFEWVSFMREYE